MPTRSDLAQTRTIDEFRRRVFDHRETRWYSSQAELDRLVEAAPMIEVLLDLPD